MLDVTVRWFMFNFSVVAHVGNLYIDIVRLFRLIVRNGISA
jgi:hypothetical protein